MLFITTTAITLLTYHLKQTNSKDVLINIYRDSELKELENILLSGTIFSPTFNIVLLKPLTPNNIKDFEVRQTEFNTTYICVEAKGINVWKEKEDPNIKCIEINPELYEAPLNKVRGLFTEDGYIYFWNKFNKAPQKLQMELNKLIIQYGNRKEIYDTDYLINEYGNNGTNRELMLKFCRCIGTPAATEILKQLDTTEIWALTIGSHNKPPLIYYNLVKNQSLTKQQIYHCLVYIQEAIKENRLECRLAYIIFNQWLISIKYHKDLEINSQQINQLKSLI